MSDRREQNPGPRSNYPAVAAGIALSAALGEAGWMVTGLAAGAAVAVLLSRRERR